MGSPAGSLDIEIDPEQVAQWLEQPTGAGAPKADTPQTGAPQTGDPQTGDPQTGDPQTGDPQTGAPQTGDPQTGAPQTGTPQVIDVREPYEREAGHIAGTRHIPLIELTSQAATVEQERPVVFYCRVGARSDMAAQAFRAAGYEAYSMSGGLVRWAQEGRPLEPENGHVAGH